MEERNLIRDSGLLEPTLTEAGAASSIYSSRAMIFVAFFGGPIAIILFSALNSRVLKTLKRDLAVYVLAAIGLLVFYALVISPPDGVNVFAWLAEYRRKSSMFRFGPRAIALLTFALGYALHSKAHRSMSFVDIEPLNPWKAGIICALIGGLVQIVMIAGVLVSKGAL